MSIGTDAVDQILRRAVSAGAAVVVVILGPDQGATPPADQPPVSAQVTTATVTPVPTTPVLAPVPAPVPDPAVPDPAVPDPAVPRTGTGRATAEPRRATTAPTTTVPPTTPTHRSTGSSRASRRTTAPTTAPITTPTTTGHAHSTAAAGSAPASAEDTPTTGTPGTGTATGGTSAAATRGWGTPARVDDFDSGTDGWQLYDGPGNNGTGRRSPGAVVVRDGLATIGGDTAGTTGGMCWATGRRYGRWEARVRAPAADPAYHPVLLLWPQDNGWPAGGEIDFMELLDPTRRTAAGFVHHGADNRVVQATVATDATRWHDWAVEWTASSITMYLDGRPWYRTTAAAVQPPGPMHLCVQLDWFPTGGPARPSTMQVDWVREYALDGAATGGAPAGATGTAATRADAG